MTTLTTSPQIVGKNEASTIRSYLYAWYDGQSGNSCTVHIKLTVVCAGTTYTGTNKSYFLQLGGYNSGVLAWKYAPLNANQEYTVAEATQTYSGGSQISASAGFWSYVYGSADIQLSGPTYVPTFNSKPTGLTVSLVETYANGAKFNVSVSSYGEPSGANGRWIEAGIAGQNAWQSPALRSAKVTNTKSAQITVNNSSTQTQTLTIQPNTRYYYGAYAWNTAMATSKMQGQLVTKAVAPAVSFNSATSTTATIAYSTSADGGYYAKNIQYSLDGGNSWRTGATVTGGAAKTGTFIITGLLSGASYNIKTRVSTTSGATNGSDVAFNTLVSEADNKNIFYGSVNNKAKEIQVVYGSVNGEATPITRLYGCALDQDAFVGNLVHTGSPWGVTAFDANQFANKMKTTGYWQLKDKYTNLMVTSFRGSNPRVYTVTLNVSGQGQSSISLVSTNDTSVLASYGLTVASLNPTNPATTDYVELHFKPVARLIHQGFGHNNYT